MSERLGEAEAELPSLLPLQSISLDSLPRGVLGGGVGPEPEPVSGPAFDVLADLPPPAPAPQPASPLAFSSIAHGASMEEMIQAAKLRLADELRRQQTRELEERLARPFSIEGGATGDGVAMDESAPAGPAVSVIKVAGVAAASHVQPPPPSRQPVIPVDEAELVDLLAHKIMPRMKVELSLWLQDALELQAKQMLSGVMHQLKEDYEMLFNETLRDSLRQAIAELGHPEREERF